MQGDSGSRPVSQYRGPILILLATVCASTTGTAQAFAPEGASPLVVGAVRLWLGFAFMLAWCFLRGKKVSIKGWPVRRTVISALGIVFYQLTFFAAVASTGVAVGTVVTCGSIPLLASVLGYVFLREKPQRVWYPATAAALAGLALLSVTDNAETNLLGLLLAVAAGFSYSVYAAFGKSLTRTYDPGVVVTVLFGIGALAIMPVFFLFPVSWMFTGQGLMICIHLGLITAAASYTLYLSGLKYIPVSAATTINLSESLLAACWGVFLLGEQVLWLQITGMALIFGSTVLLTLKTRQDGAAPERRETG